MNSRLLLRLSSSPKEESRDDAREPMTRLRLAGRGTLLRDLDDPDRFVSFSPWESLDAIEWWRSLGGWKQRVAQIREMLVGFQPATLELLVEKG